MSIRKFEAKLSTGEDIAPEITSFIELIGLERTAPDRYSLLLVLQLFGAFKSNMLNPAKVVCEIQALEGIGRPSQLKRPIQFKYPPLKGLWHKHYLPDGLRPTALNVQNALSKHGIPWLIERVREVQEASEERAISVDDCAAIADDAVYGNLRRRANAAEMTGEWIIYAQHEGANYYLCLGDHNKDNHANVRQQIDAICCSEFPFLAAQLA